MTTAPSDGRLKRSALAYAKHFNFSIFPLAPRSKLPLIAAKFGGKGLLDATKDEAQIARWWDINPEANIAIVTGEPSNLLVLDVDVGKGGEESLAELERKHGPLPETVMQYTGGGGYHFFYHHVAGLRNSAGKLGKALDTRADGGYVVAPPSIHENGRQYAFDTDKHPQLMPIAAPPAWLVELLREQKSDGKQAEMPENWRKLVAEGVAEGKRNDAIARMAGHLLRKYVDPFMTLDLLRCWNAARCKPPLPDDELKKTVKSISRKEFQRREQCHGR